MVPIRHTCSDARLRAAKHELVPSAIATREGRRHQQAAEEESRATVIPSTKSALQAAEGVVPPINTMCLANRSQSRLASSHVGLFCSRRVRLLMPPGWMYFAAAC